jgi:transglutaminase-like putative cysteine protease
MHPDSSDLDAFLVANAVIDWRCSAILTKAHELAAHLHNDVEKACRLFEWVRDEIPHSADVNSDMVTCSASEVLRAKTGICYAKSHLLAALRQGVLS